MVTNEWTEALKRGYTDLPLRAGLTLIEAVNIVIRHLDNHIRESKWVKGYLNEFIEKREDQDLTTEELVNFLLCKKTNYSESQYKAFIDLAIGVARFQIERLTVLFSYLKDANKEEREILEFSVKLIERTGELFVCCLDSPVDKTWLESFPAQVDGISQVFDAEIISAPESVRRYLVDLYQAYCYDCYERWQEAWQWVQRSQNEAMTKNRVLPYFTNNGPECCIAIMNGLQPILIGQIPPLAP